MDSDVYSEIGDRLPRPIVGPGWADEVGHVRVGPEWRLTDVGGRADRLFDQSTEALRGRPLLDVLPDDVRPLFESAFEKVTSTGGPVAFTEYLPPIGERWTVLTVPCDEGVVARFCDPGAPPAVASRPADSGLEAFGDVLSHDLATPLATLEGRLELARATGEEGHIDGAVDALRQVRTLVDGMAETLKTGRVAVDPAPVDVEMLTRGVWASLETGSATLRFEGPEAVRADEPALSRLLQNLLRNATEHGSTGSRTSPDAATEHGSTDEHTSPGDGPECGTRGTVVVVGTLEDGFYVADDGPGIDVDDRDRVFAPGYSTRHSAGGFGLFSVRQVVHAHGWSIDVTDSEAGGARFEIRGVERVR
jgi:hypothetical protein